MKKQISICLLLLLFTLEVAAGVIKGTIIDKQTREPLTGAIIQLVGTQIGVVADLDGKYSCNAKSNTYTIQVKYVGYKTIQQTVTIGSDTTIDFEMETDVHTLGDVTVTARKNLEGEKMLMLERQQATLAIENMGAKEMSLKGISHVQDGVKKITGISIADAGQLIVRGLGDRYSTTTLNGLPIASPNPDNKLIPLDLFPSSAVKNITVSKVYEAGAFADYSGAHIDISTKENAGTDFFSVDFNVGGKFNTLFKDFYSMDREKSLFFNPSVDQRALDMDKQEFESYVKTKNIFNTSFQVKKKSALPEFGGNIGFGKSWNIASQRLSILGSLGVGNDIQSMENAYVRTLEAGGNTINRFDYNSYATELKIAGLANVGYTLRQADRIGYTFFYARNAIDTYMRREGVDYDSHELIGSNGVTHIYTLQNHQLNGHHEFGKQWDINWSGSYSTTGSDEPDRRQIMFEKDGSNLKLFKLNQQETMRYFGSLSEDEWVADVRSSYKFQEKNLLRFGLTYKDKKRDYSSSRFYYNLSKLYPEISDIYSTDGYINQENVANGTLVINRNQQPKDNYQAGNSIYAGFLETEYYPIRQLLVNLGIRYERSEQWVDYYTDGGQAKRSELKSDDLFPALNLKYTFDKDNSLRFSFSRTITRPSFIEMAPFLYQESYGSAQIRGNADLKNGYNYNADLRYELYDSNNSNNLFAVTGYAKILEDPIERIQMLAGGSAVHSFQNADTGFAAGVELEIRREVMRNLRVGVNGTYMYTNVKLPEEGGSYTNSERSLQGASPYLVNADISYTPQIRHNNQLALALLYNVQGPRIHAVGISGLGDVKQRAVHTLNFVGSYEINKHFSLKLQLKDLLNQDIIFKQEIIKTGQELEVERFKKGTGIEVGFTYKL
ncbi:TonB-dependent receptor [Bacteroides reticulotermitis]|uniref:TonB-dependent receptor n=2 Tax=Bacteroides reticulotermitis TaxID=1133319 RepID=W4UT45_9BACE|nr:TonB-dependent receptor [Bacteroides reticulotermitis]MBB4045106.1 hypothetical protein [Bacteroides reticulotermitis]GAE83947.1 TonB-dependent receptor [Bacteroides reticulotermitis JCM 10512]